MIIKSSRISTSSGVGPVANHVLRGAANEAIVVLQGSETEMRNAFEDARDASTKYALRHWKVSPGEAMSTDDAMRIVSDLANEFGFEPDDATVVEHTKPRHGGAGFDHHWHVLVPELRRDGRILDTAWDRPRHEKVSRLAEMRLGHTPTPGAFNAAVARHLHAEGYIGEAYAVDELTNQPRPRESFTTTQHQAAARRGLDMSEMKSAVLSAWERSDNGDSFRAAAAEAGIEIRPGDKAGTFVAFHGDVFVGSLDRLTKTKKRDVVARMETPAHAPAIQPAPEAVYTQPATVIEYAVEAEPVAAVSDTAHREPGEDGRDELASPADAAGPAGAVGAGGDAAGRDNRSAEVDSGQPSESERTYARIRAANAAFLAGLNRRTDAVGELRQLRDSIEQKTDPRKAVSAEMTRLRDVIGREPWRDPATRDERQVADKIRSDITRGKWRAEGDLDAAWAKHAEVKKGRPWWKPWESREERERREAAEALAELLTGWIRRLRDDVAINEEARERVIDRKAERMVWTDNPERRAAQERQRLLKATMDKSSADPAARAALNRGDIDDAVQRQAKAEEQRRQEAEQRRREDEARQKAESEALKRQAQALDRKKKPAPEEPSWRPGWRM